MQLAQETIQGGGSRGQRPLRGACHGPLVCVVHSRTESTASSMGPAPPPQGARSHGRRGRRDKHQVGPGVQVTLSRGLQGGD